MRSDARKRATVDIRLDLPWTKPPITANRVRGNPYAQAAKVENARAIVAHCIQKQRPGVAPTPCAITFHFRPSTRQIRDADGLYPTAKAVIDELVAQGVLAADDWRHVRAVTCRIHQPEAPAAMWLTITEET